jgi:DNA-binding GntR family transcriptional regulator
MSSAGGRNVRATGVSDPILLTDQVYEVLRQKIVMWEFDPNDLLTEKRLADEYSVSRTPIREALALLSQEGLVEVIPRVGYRVSAISLQDVHEIFDMRVVLEGEAAARAATAATDEQLEALQATHSQWAEVLLHQASRPAEYLRFHDAFHLGIAELSGNQRLTRFIGQLLRDGTRLRMSDPLMSTDGLPSEEEDSRLLVDALMEHDAARARSLQENHIMKSKARSLQRLIEQGGGRGVHLG